MSEVARSGDSSSPRRHLTPVTIPDFFRRDGGAPRAIPNIGMQLEEAHDLRKIHLAGRIDSKDLRSGLVESHYFVAPTNIGGIFNPTLLSEFAHGIIPETNAHTQPLPSETHEPRGNRDTGTLYYGMLTYEQSMAKPIKKVRVRVYPHPAIAHLIHDYYDGRMKNTILNDDELNAICAALSAKYLSLILQNGSENMADWLRKNFMKAQRKLTPLGQQE